MRQAVSTTVRIGLLVGMLIAARPAIAGDSNPLDRARTLIAARNELEAAEVLEEALSTAVKAERGPILALLRETYTTLEKQARAKGKTHEADLYQDNIAILDREQPKDASPPAAASATTGAPGPLAAPASAPGNESATDPKTAPATPRMTPARPPIGDRTTSETPTLASPALEGPASIPITTPKRLPDPEPLYPIHLLPSKTPSSPALPEAGALPLPAIDAAETPRPKAIPQEIATPKEDRQAELGRQLKQADQAFRGRKYDEAGRIFRQLASQKALPADRNEAWAYCRWIDVVRRINAKPKTAKEWDAIEAEIRGTRELTPNNWYGEYLLSRVAEGRKSRRSLFSSRARGEKLVVRGSEPDDEVDVKLPAQGKPKPKAQQPSLKIDNVNLPPADSPSPASQPRGKGVDEEVLPANTAPALDAQSGPTSAINRWQVRETPNFRIFHHAPEIAERAAQIAESVRSAQGSRWGSVATGGSWSPKCDLYLYPDARSFAKMTGQAETSPGFTLMGANGGKIISRRVNLRTDHPPLLSAILPHEVTHVVLADLFPNKPIPRWADEGMAVLAEPPAEVQSRSDELKGPLQNNRLFAINDLVGLDYPDAKDWPTYYAQSVSLTRFLVERGEPRDFIRFLQAAERTGLEAALRNIYRIDDLAELQNQWLRYARDQATGPAVAAAIPETDSTAVSETR